MTSFSMKSINLTKFMLNVTNQYKENEVKEIKSDIKKYLKLVCDELFKHKLIHIDSYESELITQVHSLLYVFKELINKTNYINFYTILRTLKEINIVKNKKKKCDIFMNWCNQFINYSIQFTGFNLYINNVPDKDLNINEFVDCLNEYSKVIKLVQISNHSYLGYMVGNNDKTDNTNNTENINKNKVEYFVNYVNNYLKKLNMNKEYDLLKDFENKNFKSLKNNNHINHNKYYFELKYIEPKINVIKKMYNWSSNKYEYNYVNNNLM